MWASRSGHDISRDSIQGWWNELAEEGLLPQWRKDKNGNNHKKDNYYYLACRNVLVKMGWIRIDHQYHRGQAKKCYEVIPDLVGSVWSYPDDFHRTDCPTVESCDPTEIMNEDQNSFGTGSAYVSGLNRGVKQFR